MTGQNSISGTIHIVNKTKVTILTITFETPVYIYIFCIFSLQICNSIQDWTQGYKHLLWLACSEEEREGEGEGGAATRGLKQEEVCGFTSETPEVSKSRRKSRLIFLFWGEQKKSCPRGRSTRYVATKLGPVGDTRRRCRSRLYFPFHAGGREAAANHSVSTHRSPAPPPLHPHPQLPSHPSSCPFDFQGAGPCWATTARGHNLKRH